MLSYEQRLYLVRRIDCHALSEERRKVLPGYFERFHDTPTGFTVNGKGLTQICRKLYVFEEDQYGAIEILRWLKGITIKQIEEISTGGERKWTITRI